jgi:hypothetical protein
MSLHPKESSSVPEDTRRVALAAFPNGTLCLHIADALGPIYQDDQFKDLSPGATNPRQHPGGSPWRRCCNTIRGGLATRPVCRAQGLITWSDRSAKVCQSHD